jgi:hypothetical protein
MSRALTFALSHIEARHLALSSFKRLRGAFARATHVEDAAALIYAENQAIRESARGWMI